MSKDIQTLQVEVDPARLESGQWCHRANKTIGEGDINASYSADRIGMGQPVRKPFSWRGGLWVCTGIRYFAGNVTAEAYRLIRPDLFEGEAVTYSERTRNAESARADRSGFYHGMIVRHAGADFVLSGPPVSFIPGQSEQLSLF